MDTFTNLHLLKDTSKRDEIRKDLLACCHFDTLAMVRIADILCIDNILFLCDRETT